jgi:hypothetical protein
VSATKVVIILLVIVAVVFVVVVLRGPSDSAAKTPTNDTDFAKEKHPTLGKMNNLLGTYAPKVSAKSLVPSTQVVNLALTPTKSIRVLADPKQKFRQLAFSVYPSKHCASVKFSPSDKSDFNKDQDSETSGSNDHPDQFAFVLISGGQLDINRAPGQNSGTCIVTLHVAN